MTNVTFNKTGLNFTLVRQRSDLEFLRERIAERLLSQRSSVEWYRPISALLFEDGTVEIFNSRASDSGFYKEEDLNWCMDEAVFELRDGCLSTEEVAAGGICFPDYVAPGSDEYKAMITLEHCGGQLMKSILDYSASRPTKVKYIDSPTDKMMPLLFSEPIIED